MKCPLLWELWIHYFTRIILERVIGSIVNIRNERLLFFLCSHGMNRSAEQTNLPRTASRFTRFVCPALQFIPHKPRKRHSFLIWIAYLIDYKSCINYDSISFIGPILTLLNCKKVSPESERYRKCFFSDIRVLSIVCTFTLVFSHGNKSRAGQGAPWLE